MSQRTVLQVQGLHWATSERGIESALMRQPGVEAVQANAANQTATVTYDPQETSVVQLSRWVRDCGYHCAGRSVPNRVCEPMEEPGQHAGVAGTAHALPPRAPADWLRTPATSGVPVKCSTRATHRRT